MMVKAGRRGKRPWGSFYLSLYLYTQPTCFRSSEPCIRQASLPWRDTQSRNGTPESELQYRDSLGPSPQASFNPAASSPSGGSLGRVGYVFMSLTPA